ncbi:MAG: hypothetical protein NTW04_04650, partial [Elusimicrobia bacterium]|nr:hypothetical protein [Elusimicrobiota bacterium]
MKIKMLIIVLTAAFFTAGAYAQSDDQKLGSLSLDLEKANFGGLSNFEDRKNYLITVQAAKESIQSNMLMGFYERAYDFYRSGDYRRSAELCNKILSVDAKFAKAKNLLALAQAKQGIKGIDFSRARGEDKFSEGLALFNEGRIGDASAKWEEMSAISRGSEGTGLWLKRSQSKISEELIARGRQAYDERRYKDALDHWYSAVLLNRTDDLLEGMITSAERKYGEEKASQYLKQSAAAYSSGDLAGSLKSAQSALDIQPGDSRVRKF